MFYIAVGSNRKSIATKTKSGHFIITPDNGSLTHVATYMGLEEVREIDEQKNRLPYSSARKRSSARIIDVLDIRFGSLWTNIPYDLIRKANIQRGDKLTVTAPPDPDGARRRRRRHDRARPGCPARNPRWCRPDPAARRGRHGRPRRWWWSCR